MNKLRENNYINIQSFMVKDLKLKGNELLVYAIIFGFSQADETAFTGGLQYLADWTNSTKQGVIKNLKSLIDKGFIAKNERYINGIKFCEYRSTLFNGVLNKSTENTENELNAVERGIKQSLPNNKSDTELFNNQNNNKRFTPPTVEEVAAYCRERKNNVDPQKFVDYYTANGWKVGRNNMKDWRAAVRTWERNGFSNGNQKRGANGILLDDRKTDELDGIL